MFSHKINNPNNYSIDSNYYVIPFGIRCATAIACKSANLRKFSLPFDWGLYWFPKTINKILKNDFDGFCEFEPDGKIIKNIKYNFYSSHFGDNIKELSVKYKRSITRFNNILNENKNIYFVYINEDYMYNGKFREEKQNYNKRDEK